MATPTANYKMSKSTKTWLAFNKSRMTQDRYGQIRRSLIQADIVGSSPVKSGRRDDK